MSDWILVEEDHSGYLTKTWTFPTFPETWAFMTLVAFEAERHKHHPEFINSNTSLEIRLSTTDAGSQVTGKDREFAKLVDQIPL